MTKPTIVTLITVGAWLFIVQWGAMEITAAVSDSLGRTAEIIQGVHK